MSIGTKPPWAITDEKVEQAVRRLVKVAHPRKIIVFGSYVTGQTKRDSDLDVLVVVGDEVKDPLRESVRLRGLLREIRMLMDIVVVNESAFLALKDRIGLVYREACRHGRVVYDNT